MKILVIQLARFGDVYQTWPTLSALHKKYPEAEIDFLVREKFSEAAVGNPFINRIHTLPTKDILAEVVEESRLETALERLSNFTEQLRNLHYDMVINLSFSPFSSYLVSAIAVTSTKTNGYTRFPDGYLCLPDDVSAYFYAQVGVGQPNRIHLSHLFAGIAEVDLTSEDWHFSDFGQESSSLLQRFGVEKNNYILLQVGASQLDKTFSISKWSQVINHLKKKLATPVVLIGSNDERALGEQICMSTPNAPVINSIGQTHLLDLASLTRTASLVVSGDSLILHVASLTQTPTLSVSLSSVNFWETGPMSPHSRIIYGETRDDIASDRVAKEIECMLEGSASGNPIIQHVSFDPVAYEAHGYEFIGLKWQWLKALYMEDSFPTVIDSESCLALQRLNELANLAIKQLRDWSWNKNLRIQAELLSQVDTMLEILPQLAPDIQPLISWFQTERIRIGPMPLHHVIETTLSKFSDLKVITDLYLTHISELGDFNADPNVHT